MAWDAYLQLEGIKGETTRTGHDDTLAISSFNMGGALNIVSQPGEKLQVAGRANLMDFAFTRRSDAASPKLFEAMTHNRIFPTAKFTLFRAGTDSPVPFVEVEFTEVVISSLTWTGVDGGSGVPDESGTLYYRGVKVIYTATDAEGKKTGTVEGEYDAGAVE
jgi:type VI secretion system secreted protein Hcp